MERDIDIIKTAIQEILVKEQDLANKSACNTFSALIQEVKISIEELKDEVTKNSQWREEAKADVAEIHSFLEFLRYGRKFGLGSAAVIASIGVIMGAIYTIKEWLKK